MRTLHVGLRVAELQSPETRGIEPLTPALQRCTTASTSASTSITSSIQVPAEPVGAPVDGVSCHAPCHDRPRRMSTRDRVGVSRRPRCRSPDPAPPGRSPSARPTPPAPDGPPPAAPASRSASADPHRPTTPTAPPTRSTQQAQPDPGTGHHPAAGACRAASTSPGNPAPNSGANRPAAARAPRAIGKLWIDWDFGSTGTLDRLGLWIDWDFGSTGTLDRLGLWIDWDFGSTGTGPPAMPWRTEAGRDPYDMALTGLVGELTTRSEAFRARWAAHDVRLHRTGITHTRHPVVRDLHLSYEVVELAADPGLSLIAFTTQPGHTRRRRPPTPRQSGPPHTTLPTPWRHHARRDPIAPVRDRALCVVDPTSAT